MRMDFTGKHVIITGGANGIGLASAQEFRAAGAAVSILDLAEAQPEEAARRLGGRGLAVDVSQPEEVEQAFAKLPAPDVVAANAGVGVAAGLLETPRELWDRTIAINLSGVFHTVQAAAKRMKSKGGAIVITASTNSFDGEAELVAYNASKAGVLGIVATAANELGCYGIRVNAVCPGLIRTRLTKRYFDEPEVLKPYFQHIALGRGGEPEEVAAAIVFLASECASFITGATLVVDGGQMAAKYSVWDEQRAEFKGDRWRLRGW